MFSHSVIGMHHHFHCHNIKRINILLLLLLDPEVSGLAISYFSKNTLLITTYVLLPSIASFRIISVYYRLGLPLILGYALLKILVSSGNAIKNLESKKSNPNTYLLI